MTAGPRFIYVGLVDEHGACHELRVTVDAIPAAKERGWLVLDDRELEPFNAPRVQRRIDTETP